MEDMRENEIHELLGGTIEERDETIKRKSQKTRYNPRERCVCEWGGLHIEWCYMLENWTNSKPKQGRQILLIYTSNRVDECIDLYSQTG